MQRRVKAKENVARDAGAPKILDLPAARVALFRAVHRHGRVYDPAKDGIHHLQRLVEESLAEVGNGIKPEYEADEKEELTGMATAFANLFAAYVRKLVHGPAELDDFRMITFFSKLMPKFFQLDLAYGENPTGLPMVLPHAVIEALCDLLPLRMVHIAGQALDLQSIKQRLLKIVFEVLQSSIDTVKLSATDSLLQLLDKWFDVVAVHYTTMFAARLKPGAPTNDLLPDVVAYASQGMRCGVLVAQR